MSELPKTIISNIFWEELCALSPQQVAAVSGAAFLADEGCYQLEFFSIVHRVYPKLQQVLLVDAQSGEFVATSSFHAHLVLVHFLLQSPSPACGRFTAVEAFPNGEVFFRGPHTLPTKRVAARYGADAMGFEQRCKQLQGANAKEQFPADRAYILPALPGLNIAVLLWLEDDEFPARVSFLFDEQLGQKLPYDVIWTLSIETVIKLMPGLKRSH